MNRARPRVATSGQRRRRWFRPLPPPAQAQGARDVIRGIVPRDVTGCPWRRKEVSVSSQVEMRDDIFSAKM